MSYPAPPYIYILCIYSVILVLFNYSLLQILGQIEVFTSHFLHIMLHHQLYQLLETRALWIPAQLSLCFTRVTEEVHHICRSVEIRTYSHYHIANPNSLSLGEGRGEVFNNSLFVDTITFP